jgi:hypothetical protein
MEPTVNLALLKSRHAIVAAIVIVAGLVAVVLGAVPGARDAGNGTWLVVSGSVLLFLFGILFLYPVRKYAQRRGYSPEYRLEVPIETLESARSAVRSVDLRVAAAELRDRASALREATLALKSSGAGRVLRARAVRDPLRPGGFKIETIWREPLGRVSGWMRAHIAYGLAASVFVVLHGGGRMTSTLGVLLNSLSALVIVSGIVGLVLWIFGPTWLTDRERDLSIEKAAALRRHLARRISRQREAVAAIATETGQPNLVRDIDALAGSGSRFASRATTLLESLPRTLGEKIAQVRDHIVLVGQARRVEAEWRSLSKLWFFLHAWRIIHVPAAIVLLACVLIHVVAVVIY